ncbi:MAG: nucleoside deaminase [Oscillospiraceae bacterium]|jgi:tRNA(adenine34) deaminase|nr:nucleoside deaminase [Oscillospiraceae bacterium]
MNDEKYMRRALELAAAAAENGDVPVGCVVVSAHGEIIGEGYNGREKENSATAHAEITAIERACAALGAWRLEGCALYVTLEPCAMCAGAIINSRISRVIYGAKEPHTGASGSVINLFVEYEAPTAVFGGILESECAVILEEFFKGIRNAE